MASTHPGSLDSLVSIKSTPEIEVNSLQLNRDQSVASQTPQEQGFSIESSSLSDKPHPVKLELSTGDDTIQQIVTQPASPDKKPPIQALSSQMIGILATPASKTEAIATVPASGMAEQPDSRADSLESSNAKVSAYARLEFENFIFYVQTLQVVLGRKSENDQSHSVDVHLGNSKAISRKHAKIFYNFGTERFELSIQGKNGAFVDDVFVERGATVPLTNKSKIQIGQIVFRFVLPGANPQEKTESPSKPINPSDAISLKSTLYTNQGSTDGLSNSRDDTPPLTSKDFEPVTGVTTVTSSASFSNITAPVQKKAKEKKPPKPPKPPKKVYTLEEIPEEYRTKPNCSYSNLIATCLRTHGTPKGMSLAEIYKSIRDIFPYYKYCPDGWQSSVRHNLSLNKAFRKVSKEGKGWLWGLDEEYCAEKERAKKKQAAAAAAKAKAAALKLEQQQQQQQQKIQHQKQLQMAQAAQQQFQQQNAVPGANFNPQLSNIQGSQLPIQQQPLQPHQLQQFQPQNLVNPLKQEPILVKNIPLQSVNSQQQLQQPLTSTPQQHIQQQQQQQYQQQQQLIQKLPVSQPHQKPLQTLGAQSQQQLQQGKGPSIQAQLAANRGIPIQNLAKQASSPSQQQKSNPLGADTKKALAHLQQQLVLLSKDLRTLVDKPTISAILTQAIAMTIAQVTQAAKAKGITTDPLATLIETNPQQLTRILTVALNAATFKVTNGRIKAPLSVPQSGVSSRATTPSISTPPSNPQQVQRQPQVQYISPQSHAPSQLKPQPQAQLQPQQSQQQTQLPPQVQSSSQSHPQYIPSQLHPQSGPLQPQQQLHPVPESEAHSQTPQTQPMPLKPLLSQHKVVGAQTQRILVPSNTPPPQQDSQTPSAPGNLTSSRSGTGSISLAALPKSSVSPSGSTISAPSATQQPSQSVAPAALPSNVHNAASPESTPSQPRNAPSAKIEPAPVQSSSSTNRDVERTTATIELDDLNDPEFDKVLESLSKEATPGLEADDQKILDDDELNRLLATDFSEPRQKRSFDEVDPSEQGANKALRTE